MFSTGNHAFLTTAVGCFLFTFILYLRGKKKGAAFLFLFSYVCYTIYLAGRCWLGGVFLPNPFIEGPFFLPWCLATIVLVKRLASDNEDWGLLIIPVLIFSCFALWYPKGIIPPGPQKNTVWTILFFLTEIPAHALFYTGAFMGILYVIREDTTDFFHNYIVWGFVLFSISQIVGAVWSFKGWGNTFSWSPRHFTTAAMWLMYAAYIHLKFVPSWNTRKRAFFAVLAGIIVMVFSYSHYIHELNFPRIGG